MRWWRESGPLLGRVKFRWRLRFWKAIQSRSARSNRLLPPAFEHVVTTCLQKNPEERYQTAHDIRLELQWIAADKSSPAAAAPVTPAPSRSRERLGWVAAVVLGVVLGVVAGMFINRAPQSPQAIRTVIDPPANAQFSLTGDFAGPPVLSPDGSRGRVCGHQRGRQDRTLGSPHERCWRRGWFSGTEGTRFFPSGRPTAGRSGFFADSKLKTTDLNGGSPAGGGRCSLRTRGGVGAGRRDPLHAEYAIAPLLQVSGNGGDPVPVTKLDPARHTSHRWPFLLPDGKHFLYLAIHHDPAKAANDTLYYASLDGRENRALFRSQSNAVYGSGFLLFARGDQLMEQPFDPASGTLGGEAQSLANGVVDDISTWHMDASASNNGLLILGSGGTADWQLVWMDRNGRQIGTVADKLTNLQAARLSPQGDRVALQIDTGINDIWVLDLARGVRTRLNLRSGCELKSSLVA